MMIIPAPEVDLLSNYE